MKCALIFQPEERLLNYLKHGLKDCPAELVWAESKEPEHLREISRGSQILVGWRPSAEMLKDPALRLFVNPGVGIKHHLEPFKEARIDKTVTLINGHGNADFTAQHAVAMLLTLTNKLLPHHQWMIDGRWRLGDKEAKSIPLRGQTVGLLGYGHINKAIRTFLSGFDLNFCALTRQRTIPDKSVRQYQSSEIDSFLTDSDIVIMALPHTQQTDGLMTLERLKMIGPQGILINISRGQIVDEEALYSTLKEKELGAAGIDVWYDYSPEEIDGQKRPYTQPFHLLKNVVLSPHRAASPFDDLSRWDEQIDAIKKFVVSDGQARLQNVVDLDAQY
jgi:phosphoglycerate dehydrogenase-like enzyme